MTEILFGKYRYSILFQPFLFLYFQSGSNTLPRIKASTPIVNDNAPPSPSTPAGRYKKRHFRTSSESVVNTSNKPPTPPVGRVDSKWYTVKPLSVLQLGFQGRGVLGWALFAWSYMNEGTMCHKMCLLSRHVTKYNPTKQQMPQTRIHIKLTFNA